MLIKIFSLSFCSANGGFDDTDVCAFLKDKEVVSISDHFFVRNEVPHLTLIIKYLSTSVGSGQVKLQSNNKREAWKETLTEADMGMFNILRNWRDWN